jgi:16S rRNA (guanine966-N2)-methyltransferase
LARQLNNRLKIISGKYKSRLIDIPEKSNLRPSKAYIRETLFNVIETSLCKSSLDLFSGSGILSFEALSRGINSATLVERDSELVKSIQSNIRLLDIKGAYVVKEKVEKYLLKSDEKAYDLIFVDPPYNTSLLIETLGLLKNYKYLENNKFLYFEKSKKDERKYDDFFKSTHIAIKDLSIGDVSYTILINKNL